MVFKEKFQLLNRRIKSNYVEEWRFFRSKLLFVFILSCFILIITAIFVYIYSMSHPHLIESGIKKSEHLVKAYQGTSNSMKCIKIFLNNLLVSVETTVLGAIPFLFLPIWMAVKLGYVLGVIFIFDLRLRGLSVGYFITTVMPHGIFEIPALLYSVSIGIYITIEVSKKIVTKNRKSSISFLDILKKVYNSYVLVIIPMLFLATMIEVFITPWATKGGHP